MSTPRIDSAFKLAATYAGFGALWIVVSDGLAALASNEGGTEWMLGTLKGLAFIGVTAWLLHGLVQRIIARHQDTEKALRESEQRLALVLEASKQGYFDHNVLTGEAVVNDTYARMLGYDPAGFRENFESVRQRVHPDDLESTLREYQLHLAGQTDFHSVEYRLRTADGGWRWILARGRVVERDAQGRALRVLGTHTDISERKQAEARTADALSFAKAVIHSSPTGIVAYGPDGTCVSANASAARILGGEIADLLRQNYQRLESWQRSGLLTVVEQALQSGMEKVFQGPLHTAFGRELWVEVHVVPFNYMDARHLLLLIKDETGERRTKENLHLLHAAVQATSAGWVITDAAGIVEWVNPAFTQLTGYAAAEAFGMKTSLLRSGRHTPEFYHQLWETVMRGEVWSGEICNRRKDGTLYDEHMTIAPVRDGAGAIRHFVAMKQDITEHKQLQQQLTRTQRLESIGMLASGIAHDLNNVLTPILLSIELLRTKYPAPDAQRYIETVQSAAQRGAGIVRQVLTFARGMDGGERTEVQPRYLLKDVVNLITETFPRNIEIHHDVPRDVSPVTGDLTQLHQVMLNLAVNARDAMPRGGALTLAARNLAVDPVANIAHRQLKAGPYVALSVTDTGTGITPEVLEHMFEPFYTTKPRGKGTGLGLSTVYGIVRSHGGGIDVRSQLGQGTTFEILLPAALVPQPAGPAADTPVMLPGGGRRILVVDDEEAIRSIMMRVLARHGFVPVPASDGCDGLKAFLTSPRSFSAAIVDMVMPRMGGAELARNIHLAVPELPIVISTGMMNEDPDADMQAELKHCGIRALLRKPYTEDEFMKVLSRELETPPVKA